jgi:flagellar basal body-associated protein FliL
MSDEKKTESNDEGSPSKLPLILTGVNILALLGLLGLVVYTRVLFVRPKITESSERKRLEDQATLEASQKKKNSEGIRVLMKLDPITANLKPTEIGSRVAGAPPVGLKPHFAQMSFALELVDARYEEQVKAQIPKFLDALLKSLSAVTVEEIATVQGRVTLRNKIIGTMNEFARKSKVDPPIVTNVYFNEFMIQ